MTNLKTKLELIKFENKDKIKYIKKENVYIKILPKKLKKNNSQSLFLGIIKNKRQLKQLKIISVIRYHFVLNFIFSLYSI